MSSKIKIIITLLFSLLLTVLFHKKALGINLFIAETILLFYLIISKQYKFQSFNTKITFLGVLITSIATVVIHSILSYFINFLSLFILIGVLLYPEVKSLLNSIQLSFYNLFNSQIHFFNTLLNSNINGIKTKKLVKKTSIFIIPLFIIFLFIIIYRNSNPVFDKLISNFLNFTYKYIALFFENIDFTLFFTILICLFISNLIIFRTIDKNSIDNDINASFLLKRTKVKKNRFFKFNDLKNEYKAGIFLLIVLNVLLLIVNLIDINFVWFNFKWEGQFLKQFVHEGTFLLILSILISIGLVLFFFRKNLNFYSNNKTLKYLSYAWLIQNGVLTISVAIRNFYYINYFSLAYKRIGVLLFLILTLYGLYTVFNKVKNKKTAFYLFQTNFLALFILLIVSSIINWDKVIVNYNFKHANHSFLELNYLVYFSDKTLPDLDKSLLKLEEINKMQTKKFPYAKNYMSPKKYHSIIQNRKENFIKDWEDKGFLSWNLAEYLAYEKIKTSSIK